MAQFILQVTNIFVFFFFIKDSLGLSKIDDFYFEILNMEMDMFDIRSKVVFLTNSVKNNFKNKKS